MVLSDFCEKIKISRCRWPGYCGIALNEVSDHFVSLYGDGVHSVSIFDRQENGVKYRVP